MDSLSSNAEAFRLGRTNRLRILRLTSIGAYLEWQGTDGILMPKAYLPEGAEVGDVIESFVYHDNEGRLIATTLTPLVEVGQCALLECLSTTDAGAFVGWGIHKDLLVPYSEQRGRMQEGKHYMVYAYVDRVSGKIVGSAKLSKHIGLTLPDYKPGAKVQGIVAEMNDVGYRIVVDGAHWGIIYFGDLVEEPRRAKRPRLGGRKDGLNLRLVEDAGFSADSSVFDQMNRLERGSLITAYVVRLREDGRLDLSLRPIGYDKVEGEVAKLLRLLRQRGGRLPIGDKSPAEEVMTLTGMSKKTFKMALGSLLRAGRVRLEPTAVYLRSN